jgi:hypothetical protein
MSQHGNPAVFPDRFAAPLQMTETREPVQEHSGETDFAVEHLKSPDHGGNGSGGASGVADEKDRPVEENRDLGGGSRPILAGTSVIKPGNAFDHRKIGGLFLALKKVSKRPAGKEKRIEIAGNPPGEERVQAGIDEVRTDLIGLDGKPFACEQVDDPQRGGRLARPAVSPRNDNARNGL